MPRKKSTSSKNKKGNLDMEYIDGAIHDENHEKSKSIEEILVKKKNPFGTNSIDTLEEMLEGMNLRQVQELAVKASVFPSGNKTSLKNKIRKEFKNKYGTKEGGVRYTSTTESPVAEEAIAEKVRNILNSR